MSLFIQKCFKISCVTLLALVLACTTTNKSSQINTIISNQPSAAVQIPEEKSPEENRFSKVVPLENILHCESDSNYTHIVLKQWKETASFPYPEGN
jgi:hypothetical protein